MIITSEGTVFNVKAQTIVNTVNCVGVMGAGIALEFKLRFPEMFADYRQRCELNQVRVGRPYLYTDYKVPWILNFPTKEHWRNPSRLAWIENGLAYFAGNYERGGITSVAFPKLGSDRGRLSWDDIRPLMERYLGGLPIAVYMCLDAAEDAYGTEGKMVSLINSPEGLKYLLTAGTNPAIVQKVADALPIRRFHALRDINGIGPKSYEHIFKILYARTHSPSESTVKQLPLI